MKKSDWNHLAKITMANLPPGKINLTEDEILSAMTSAVAKESGMCQQLLTDNRKIGEFQTIIAPMVWMQLTGNEEC